MVCGDGPKMRSVMMRQLNLAVKWLIYNGPKPLGQAQ